METQRIVLASRPKGEPVKENFRLESAPVPALEDGQVLLKTKFLSLDPYMRGRMNDEKSYFPPIQINEVMCGSTIGEVLDSKAANINKGDLVVAYSGWQTLSVERADTLQKISPVQGIAPSAFLGVLGMPGLTAYVGLLEIGRPKPNETVCVAAATGPVGSAVGQIAKIKGAKTIGIAGGAEKVKLLKDKFHFDIALDHRDPQFAARLKDAAPNGIDVYFENVGDAVFEAVLPLLNDFARVPVCGLVSHYNATELPSGPNRVPEVMGRILRSRLEMRGFIISDHLEAGDKFRRDMLGWIKEGRVQHLEDVTDGLDRAPETFIGMLKGRNKGKVVIRLG